MNKRIRKKNLKKINAYVNPKETWSLDTTIAKYILPRLKLFKKLNNGYPQGRYGIQTMEDWNKQLDKMIEAFDFAANKFEGWEYSEEELNEKYEMFEEGMELFSKAYFDLWW